MLSDLACKSLITRAKKTNRRQKRADGKGLALVAFPNGSASWRYKYRILGREKQLSLGPYPIVALSEARIQHAEAYKQVLNGIDPSKAKQEVRNETFKMIGEEWYARNVVRWGSSYADNVKRVLEHDLYPEIGERHIASFTKKQLVQPLQKIEKRGSQSIAQIAAQLLNTIFEYAELTEAVVHNPAVGLAKCLLPRVKGQRASIEIGELPDFLANLQSAKVTRMERDAIELLMLTLVRRSELLSARWPEFDFKDAVWTIPAERMKMDKAHIVPLSRQAMSILTQRHAENEVLPSEFRSPYVFPSLLKVGRPISCSLAANALIRMGYRDKLSPHGFRALGMGIAMEKLGYPYEVADRQLAHVPSSGVRRAYDRAQFLDQRKEMMQRLADYIDGMRPKLQTAD